jgi:hypothetical protein
MSISSLDPYSYGVQSRPVSSGEVVGQARKGDTLPKIVRNLNVEKRFTSRAIE